MGLFMPGAPILRFISWEGLTKSRALFVAGEAAPVPASMGLETGRLLLWSMPAVLRMEGLSAWGSKTGAPDGIPLGLSRRRSTARAEKNDAEGVPGSVSWGLGGSLVVGAPNSRLMGTAPLVFDAAAAACAGGTIRLLGRFCWGA